MAISPESVVTRFHQRSFEQSADVVEFLPFEQLAGTYINAIGYRRTDNLIYGINPSSHDLFSIDATGQATFVTSLSGINRNHHYIAGDVSPDGSRLVIQGGKYYRQTKYLIQNGSLLI